MAMAVEGLCVRPEVTELSPVLRAGRPDVGEAVGVTLEMYRLLGFTPDVDTAIPRLGR